MKRVASHFVVLAPEDIRRNAVMELDDNSVLTQVFGLNDAHVEASYTQFFDGIISAPVVSMSSHCEADKILELTANYHFIDFSKEIPTKEIIPNGKPLIIDFGTENPLQINALLPKLPIVLSAFSVFEIISACVFYPALLLTETSPLEIGVRTSLIIWQNADLVNKTFTEKTNIRSL
jgi:hypothetical protein